MAGGHVPLPNPAQHMTQHEWGVQWVFVGALCRPPSVKHARAPRAGTMATRFLHKIPSSQHSDWPRAGAQRLVVEGLRGGCYDTPVTCPLPHSAECLPPGRSSATGGSPWSARARKPTSPAASWAHRCRGTPSRMLPVRMGCQLW